jgi:ATP-dependent Clp protease adapter protein ClpS
MSFLPPAYPPCYSSIHRPFQLPQFRVVILGQPDMKLMDVVRAIMDLTRLAREEAMHRMWQAHYDGRAEVCVTHLEKAELVADQLTHRGLSAKVEPADR